MALKCLECNNDVTLQPHPQVPDAQAYVCSQCGLVTAAYDPASGKPGEEK